MGRIEKILVGIDLAQELRSMSSDSEPSLQPVVQEALDLAATWNAAVTFCSVNEFSGKLTLSIVDIEDRVRATFEERANRVLSRLVDYAKSRSVEAGGSVRNGIASDELVKESMSGQHDLILVGAGRRSQRDPRDFGRTSKAVVQSAAAPVWIVSASSVQGVRDAVFATDLSLQSLPAFHLAIVIARAIDARLYLLHVVEPVDRDYHELIGISAEEIGRSEEALRQVAEERLRDQMRQTDFRTLPYGVKIEVLIGNADDVISQFVTDHEIDLVIRGGGNQWGRDPHSLASSIGLQRLNPQTSLVVVRPAGEQQVSPAR